jgi:hypothetical protein
MPIISSSSRLKAIPQSILPFFKGLVSLALLLALCTGCSQISQPARQLPNLLPNYVSEGNLQFQVTPSGNSGRYTITGNTNFPEKSRIAIAAIRYLRPQNQLVSNLAPKTTFSILDYQVVEVNEGKWQAELALWKVAPDGQFQETWQLDRNKLEVSLEPTPEVSFLATLAPTERFAEVERRLERQGIKLSSKLVRNTPSGQRYVQAIQVLPIALPTGQTAPPQKQPEDINGGWGNRFLLIPEPPNINTLEMPDERRTNAPLSPREFLQ